MADLLNNYQTVKVWSVIYIFKENGSQIIKNKESVILIKILDF